MKLPSHLKVRVDIDSATPGQRLVLMYDVVIGSYNPRHSGGGWAFRTTTGAHGETQTEWGAIVSLVELANTNARIQQRQTLEKMSFEEWKKLFVRFGGGQLMGNDDVAHAIYDERLDAFDADTFAITKDKLSEVST